MNENALKIQEKYDEASKLVNKFGSQSQQLQDAQKQLQNAQKELEDAKETLESKLEEVITSVYKEIYTAKQWYEKTTEDIGDVCYNFKESFGALETAFNEENFKELCQKITELSQILEECKIVRDDLLRIKSDIVKEINEKIEAEMEAIHTQEIENRVFMETKFSELFEKITSPITKEVAEKE